MDEKTCIRDMSEAERLYVAQGTPRLGVYVVLADCYRLAGQGAEKEAACVKAKKLEPVTASDRMDAADRIGACGQ